MARETTKQGKGRVLVSCPAKLLNTILTPVMPLICQDTCLRAGWKALAAAPVPGQGYKEMPQQKPDQGENAGTTVPHLITKDLTKDSSPFHNSVRTILFFLSSLKIVIGMLVE